MPVSKKQLTRLIRLVAQLKENRYPNCTSFAAELKKADLNENLNLACTEKTVYRDIQILMNDFDAPIKFSNAQNGYYLTHHGWNFACPQLFEDSEMLAAVLGARVAEHIFPEVMSRQIREAVDYLLTYNNPDFLDKTQVDSLVIIPTNKAKVNPDVFMPLFYAWQNHEICHIAYIDSKGAASERDFEPHALVFFDGVWYSKGFCHAKDEMRTLVIARMTSVVPSGKYFEPKTAIIKTSNEEGIFDPEMVEDVHVTCDEYLTNIIQTRPLHPEQKIVELPDGGCELRVKSMSKYRLQVWIMHQCGRATLLEPTALREQIIMYGEKIVSNHNLASVR